MPNNLYMSFSQEAYSQREYPSAVVQPSVSYSFWSDKPRTTYKVGDIVRWEKFLSDAIKSNYEEHSQESKGSYFVITKIRLTDEVIGERNGYPFRQWQFTFDGYLTSSEKKFSEDEVIFTKYSVKTEELENKDTLFHISFETLNFGDAPIVKYSIGDNGTSSVQSVEIPGLSVPFTCTNYSYSDAFNELDMHVWTVLYEGSAVLPYEGELDDNADISVSYEINGSTVYTVDGELLALRRSEKPIMKKTITIYSNSADKISTPGSTYDGGIVLSESIVKETIKNNNVIINTYYKHTIEVECGKDNTSSTDGGADGS